MAELSLKDRLKRYMLNRHSEWIPKGYLLDIVHKETTYTAENAGRRLRELEDEGVLEVKYVKKHAHYRAKKQVTWQEAQKAGEELWNSIP